ncbi:D-glycerate dehydrogenase [Flavobacteriaceae bacterium XHP0103]|uniref:2-hydroxyacid dehydrogenase n=1 Tax=Marixanthotalea marina TaxID=2844359 RepID=UPI002989A5B0|nr:D-glycerate dehydrogenase [Marixanthotalea marina]MBU3822128.1 D-glycerate dehydrogenase [Marixanthotalea marina]
MANKRIFISKIFPELGAQMLKDVGFEVTAWSQDRPMTQEELIEKAKTHDALFCSSSDKIDKYFLNACSHLEIISQFSAGYDNIDVAEATRLGIPLGHAPNAMNDATADIAFGLMIAVSRKMFYMHKQIINANWTHFKPTANLGMELKNKTLGIVGLGRIGTEMAKRCKGAYNMNIIYNNTKPNKQAEAELNATYVDFKTLLQQSDVLSVHCALTEKTKGLFNAEAFAQMKPTAIFINASRGQVHNETDLIEALKNKTIWGAGLDVTNPEPMQHNNSLLHMENVCVLPHIGSATVEARNEMARLAATNIIEFYKNGTIPNMINPDIFLNN